MSSSTRVNFKQPVIKKLRDRVNDMCSNPDCRKVTKGADSDSGTTSIGEAAHIIAASSGNGAARADASVSHDVKQSYDNGIWLCKNCHKMIDSDESKYTLEVLYRWKKQAEEFSRTSLGKPLYTEDDVRGQVMDSVVQHVTGSPLSTALGSASEFVSHLDGRINKLDPRFEVQTDVVNGKSKSYIYAKEDATLHFEFNVLEEPRIDDKFNLLKKHGTPFEVSSKSVKITGSPLFEEISKQSNGLFKLSPAYKKTKLDIYTCNDVSTQSLGSINAKQFKVTDSLIFEGEGLNKVFNIRIKYGLSANKLSFTYGFDFSQWYGKPISKLPFFPKLYKALAVASQNGYFAVEFFDGEHELSLCPNQEGTVVDQGQLDHFKANVDQVYRMLDYLNDVRIVCKVLGIDPKFKEFNVNEEAVENMRYVSYVISNANNLKYADMSTETFSLRPSSSEAKASLLAVNGTVHDFAGNEAVSPINILGDTYDDIYVVHQYRHVLLRLGEVVKDDDSNEPIKVTLVPNEESRYSRSIRKAE
ncbi:HNH endonuclease signature motif containing protein [Vibrio barjaei]|uniref:HNH endonuclease signature motif containing protein n=1 Tax=Vibrio barjaei TaxID=1676683 RepID=UPI00228468AA|nr:HNH endonuclease signature motif containing protein [Vibrio barjaei]MCY9871657.1 HNH endonuclease signature motif containing protein [Vibrio barjaei]